MPWLSTPVYWGALAAIALATVDTFASLNTLLASLPLILNSLPTHCGVDCVSSSNSAWPDLPTKLLQSALAAKLLAFDLGEFSSNACCCEECASRYSECVGSLGEAIKLLLGNNGRWLASKLSGADGEAIGANVLGIAVFFACIEWFGSCCEWLWASEGVAMAKLIAAKSRVCFMVYP